MHSFMKEGYVWSCLTLIGIVPVSYLFELLIFLVLKGKLDPRQRPVSSSKSTVCVSGCVALKRVK